MFLTKLTRPGTLRLLRRPAQLAQFSSDGQPPSDDGKPSEKPKKASEKEQKPKEGKSESAADRLNRLLASMSTEEHLPLSKQVKIPQASPKKHKKASKTKPDDQKPENIVEAAKKVAELVGDKTRQTEAELLSKLLNQKEGDKAAKGKEGEGGELSLSDLIVGMKVDRSKKPAPTPTRGEFVRKAIASRRDQQTRTEVPSDTRQRPRRPRPTQPVPSAGTVNLFGDRLGIFKSPESLRESPDILETWDHLYKRELKLAVVHPPANYFEKMILWTEQGKIWKFPIDNEQGLDDEAKVDFTEHIFLEQHLEGWCPERGPVRHFMELVCVGLSKNPYITAQEKKEHILWYRDYFESKKELLKQVIVDQKEAAKGGTKSLEN